MDEFVQGRLSGQSQLMEFIQSIFGGLAGISGSGSDFQGIKIDGATERSSHGNNALMESIQFFGVLSFQFGFVWSVDDKYKYLTSNLG